MKKGTAGAAPLSNFSCAPMSLCNEQCAVKSDRHNAVAVTLPCNAWTCDDCNPNRHRKLVAQAIGGIPTKFITLTSRRRDGITPDAAARELAHAWRLIRLRVMRRYRWKALPFIAVFEKTKLGWPHLHILARCGFIEKKFLSDCMNELASSPIVDIQAITQGRQCAAYCGKYCGKATARFGTSKRYWQSRDYDQREKHVQKIAFDPYNKWYLTRDTIHTWLAHRSWAGWDTVSFDGKRAQMRKRE